MDLNLVLKMLRVLIYIILGGLALYYQTNAKLREKATALIVDAEAAYRDTVKCGGAKHSFVVNNLYALIPVYLKPIITLDVVSAIVDNAFYSVESYAIQQLDKAAVHIISTDE